MLKKLNFGLNHYLRASMTYAIKIRDVNTENKGDLPAMERVVKAIWHHYASTEDTPLHDYCPEGPDSWCKWQCDQANGTSTFSPKKVALL